jgi:hypothetical protein
VIGRRAVLGGMAAMAAGGNPVQRPDQRLTGTSRAGVGPAPQNQLINPVIVITAGRALLIYSPAPGLNNLIASIAPDAGTDSFGNSYLAGITTYEPGLSLPFPPVIAMSLQAGALVGYSAASEAGPWTQLGTLNPWYAAGIGWSTDTGQIIGGDTEIQGTLTVNEALTATGGTATNPSLVETDTWHTITLAATWTAATPIPQYRLNADGLIELKGAVIFTSTGAGLSGNNAFTAAGAIPSAYQPASIQYFAAVLIGGSGAPTITANKTPVISLSAAGELTLLNVSSTGAAGDTVTFSFSGVAFYQVAN